ncbi:MFS transporter [Streptomyces phaeolivaceus]|uniref:MFS transporter n=1 Tax=Streptomyces phaeolivaceus TaxID=2653200 RepID=UPI001D0556C4|nr:MFS transporter [Streptomyces phaeolivaceus]
MTDSPTTPQPPTLRAARRGSRRLALGVICLGQLMIVLDGTVVYVALPALQRGLDLSPSGLSWVVNAYLVPFAGLLLLSGRLGDLLGRTRVFVMGMAVFTVASLLCGLAGGPGLFLGARVAQGVGGALASAVSLAMVVALFPDPGERARALGVYSFVQSAGGTLGQLVGGVLTQLAGWPWIFFVNVPFGVLTLALAVRFLDGGRDNGPARSLDVMGAALVTGALSLAVYTIVGASDHGWNSPHTLGLGALAAVMLAGFTLRQTRAADPLLSPRFLASRTVTGALVTLALLFAAVYGFQFHAALYMQDVLGLDQLRTGAGLLPASVLIGLMSLVVAPWLIARLGTLVVLWGSLPLVGSGLLLFGQVSPDGSYVKDVLPGTVPLGIGLGLVIPALADLVMSGADARDSGLASGVFSTMQQIGSALGLSAVSALAVHRTAELTADGTDSASALTSGYRLAFHVGLVLVLLAWLVAVRTQRAPRAVRPGPGDAEQEQTSM